ncbi:MAG: hypothetical protein FRX48_08112 [Lasallia pustulata]|uniref:Uncharacterized protein n=1 Tax=Lasallia pustulata TaxID=136370 RepID=A0A5M8PHH2_9LECA|nr:MAG: hypothetical protein FRX48_08112 [Lasallia pustulata]
MPLPPFQLAHMNIAPIPIPSPSPSPSRLSEPPVFPSPSYHRPPPHPPLHQHPPHPHPSPSMHSPSFSSFLPPLSSFPYPPSSPSQPRIMIHAIFALTRQRPARGLGRTSRPTQKDSQRRTWSRRHRGPCSTWGGGGWGARVGVRVGVRVGDVSGVGGVGRADGFGGREGERGGVEVCGARGGGGGRRGEVATSSMHDFHAFIFSARVVTVAAIISGGRLLGPLTRTTTTTITRRCPLPLASSATSLVVRLLDKQSAVFFLFGLLLPPIRIPRGPHPLPQVVRTGTSPNPSPSPPPSTAALSLFKLV